MRDPHFPPVYVAVWRHNLDAGGRQVTKLRPVCNVCAWRGKVRESPRLWHEDEDPEGEQAAREARRHLANAHPEIRLDAHS